MPSKTKQTQPETPEESQGRDNFQTPNYAIDLLIPYIPKREIYYIWEPAAGEGKIAKRLLEKLKPSITVSSSDIKESSWVSRYNIENFLSNPRRQLTWEHLGYDPIIITNPPFSLKQKFYERCLEYKIPFALLIPADYSGWIIEAVRNGAEKLLPTRRVDYITPSGLSGATGHTSNFHSMWLCYGFNLGKTETFVELSLEEKKNNI